jgi:nitric oxide reductase subunit C
VLTKSAARTFFLVGTVVCGLAFIGLTVDTFKRLPGLTRAAELTPAVARGKDLWDSSNCMGCHTLLGEGAYYAPELTRVTTSGGARSSSRSMLRDPEAMYPGRRRMQQYDFTEQQISDLVAFFEWVDRHVDLNGFPPRPPSPRPLTWRSPQCRRRRAQRRTAPIFDQMCTACHAVGGPRAARRARSRRRRQRASTKRT